MVSHVNMENAYVKGVLCHRRIKIIYYTSEEI